MTIKSFNLKKIGENWCWGHHMGCFPNNYFLFERSYSVKAVLPGQTWCTGWGQCIGTAIRGYCKAGVKDTWKWY